MQLMLRIVVLFSPAVNQAWTKFQNIYTFVVFLQHLLLFY